MITDVFAAVRLLLLADATVNELCAGQIYANKAEESAKTPYLIISLAAGRTDAQTLERDTNTFDLNVKAVGDSDKQQAAVTTDLAREIKRVLHRCQLSIAGYEFHQMKHRTPFYFDENKEQRRYTYAGGIYRLEIDEVIA